MTIRYGGRTILDSVDWTVRRGEKWTLTGANGSGKSTLLSLLCADNPQAYAQDISLFGRRRGTGESPSGTSSAASVMCRPRCTALM